jgi:hypothetical protein
MQKKIVAEKFEVKNINGKVIFSTSQDLETDIQLIRANKENKLILFIETFKNYQKSTSKTTVIKDIFDTVYNEVDNKNKAYFSIEILGLLLRRLYEHNDLKIDAALKNVLSVCFKHFGQINIQDLEYINDGVWVAKTIDDQEELRKLFYHP